jgi:chemotaxis protein CheC
MELNLNQKDALTELINIGYTRAAGALSEITGHRISLEVPEVAICTVPEITGKVLQVIQGEVNSVNQVFLGPVNGNAILLLDGEAAFALNGLLTEMAAPSGFDGVVPEIITEVGNIVLNACLGTFANLLNIQVSFTVPIFQVESVNKVIHSLTIESQPLEYALIVQTCFHLREREVKGFLVIILGVTSFATLLAEVKKWEEREIKESKGLMASE